MGKNKHVLIFGEMEAGSLSPMTTQLLGIGRKLAGALKQEVHLLFLGAKIDPVFKTGFCYGADKVLAAVDPLFENYVNDSYLQAVTQVVRARDPEIVLFGQNDKGMDLAPRLAVRLHAGVTLDCVDLDIDAASGLLKQVKPVFGGKVNGHYYTKNAFPQIVSVRDRVFEPADHDEARTGEVEVVDISLDVSRVRSRFIEKQRDDGLNLAQKLLNSSVVISGGRGLKEKEGFEVLRRTAELLIGTVAGSRPAIDYGWLPNALQVGLTGKKVSPEIYFAVGISGAIQHMAGCLKSKVIVAINEDREAPIFTMAHYGVVGDYKEVLTAFNDELEHIKSGA